MLREICVLLFQNKMCSQRHLSGSSFSVPHRKALQSSSRHTIRVYLCFLKFLYSYTCVGRERSLESVEKFRAATIAYTVRRAINVLYRFDKKILLS